jgi:hypothetical protein
VIPNLTILLTLSFIKGDKHMRKIKLTEPSMTKDQLTEFNNQRILRESLERQLDNCNWTNKNELLDWERVDSSITETETKFKIEYE